MITLICLFFIAHYVNQIFKFVDVPAEWLLRLDYTGFGFGAALLLVALL